MNDELYNRVIKEAVNRWGRDQQLLVLCEEMGELMQAVSKFVRNKTLVKEEQLKDNIIEEMVDVLIMFSQLGFIFDIDHEVYKDKMNLKKSLLAERLGFEEY